MVKRSIDLEFAYREEVIVLRNAKIEHAQSSGFHATTWFSVIDLYAVTQKDVFFTVGLKSRMGCAHLHDDANGVLLDFGRKVGIKFFGRLAQVTHQHDILVAGPPRGSV